MNVKEDGFTDVVAGSWYEGAVRYVYEKGLMQGTGNATFSPGMTTNRAMIATILWRLKESPVASHDAAFTDVPTDTWYTNAVRWAASEGIVVGYGNDKFGPNDSITREQLAVMLYRYEGSPETSGDLSQFPDAETVSSWAQTAIAWVVQQGIITGKGGGALDPLGQASRAEVATMLMRYCES